ncbi:RNA helicase required for poly(A+) mRNA export [Tulasnella sp. 332]|nr:RNA helicase required for poly(A+) mRNA export [Tulasnella sp. 332]
MSNKWHSSAELNKDAAIYAKWVLVLAGVAVWSILSNLPFDWKIISRRLEWKWPMILYFFCRICMVLHIFAFAVNLNAIQEVPCQRLMWICKVTGAFGICGATIILVLRVSNVWEHQKTVWIPLACLCAGQAALWFTTFHYSISRWNPATRKCQVVATSPIGLIVSVFYYTSILNLGMTFVAFFRLYNPKHRAGPIRVFFRENLAYFLASFGVNFLQAVFASLGLNAVMDIISVPFAVVISVIAATAVFRGMYSLQDDAEAGVSMHIGNRPSGSVSGGLRTIGMMDTRRRRRSDAFPMNDLKTQISEDGVHLAQQNQNDSSGQMGNQDYENVVSLAESESDRRPSGFGKEEEKPDPAIATLIKQSTGLSIRGAAGPSTEKKEEEVETEVPIPQKASELIETSHEVTVTLNEQQANPDSPLHSIKSFEDLGLSPDLLKGLYQMGFQKPSKIQERALPLLLATPPRNMIGQSQSGTGKTAAFTLAMLSRVDFSLKATQAICLAPSRELARQIMNVITTMGSFTPVTTAFAIQDANARGANVDAHIVVGTPGTMVNLLNRKQIKANHIKIFVVDEADNMLDLQGLGEQTIRARKLVPSTTQIVLFSATFPEKVRIFANKFAPTADEIKLKQEELSVEGIRQLFMDCKDEQKKYDVLVQLYNILTIGQSIIFCKKRETADVISQRMTAEGHQVVSLHGAKEAVERDQVIDDFRDGKCKVLITTNVIARGIDILQVNMVVNYDLPMTVDNKPDVETYLHRIGAFASLWRACLRKLIG